MRTRGVTAMPRAPRRLFALASTLVLLVAAGTVLGCGGDDDSAGEEAPASTPTDTTDRPGGATTPAESASAARVVRAHLEAVSRGDRDAYFAAVDDNTRFDIGGRPFNGRDAIGGFFDGELSGGRYSILRETPTADGVTFDLDFDRRELHEELRYSYTVENGQIKTLVATYR
jgi:hypothetical protein